MPNYLVKVRSFINGKLYEPGDKVDFDGKAGSNLHLIAGESDDNIVIDQQIDVDAAVELEDLRKIYEEMFGEPPHKNTSAKILKEKIDARRKELGV